MKLNRYLAFIACSFLSANMLIGCTNSAKNNTAEDYTITLSKEYSYMTADDAGNIYGITVDFSADSGSGTSDTQSISQNASVTMDVINSNGKITKTLNLPSGNVSTFAVNRNNIFVFYFDKIDILDNSGKTVKELTFSSDIFVAKPVSIGDKVFFMLQDNSTDYFGNGANMELAYVGPTSDSIKKPGITDVFNIMKYKDNIIKLYSYDESGDIKTTNFDASSLNIKDSTTETNANIDIDTEYSQINDKVYIFNYSGLFEKNYGDSFSKTLMSFDGSEYSSMQLAGNNLYLFGPYDKKVRVISVSALDTKMNNQQQIVIYTQDGSITDDDSTVAGKAIQKFKKNHPDIAVSFQNVDYDKYYDDLNAKVMTQDNSFDIFYLPESKIDSYINNGVMADLKDNKNVMDNFNNNINPNLVKLVSRDGYYFGVPIMFVSNVITLNIDKFAELSIDLPGDVWTYDDYFNILSKLRDKDKNLYFQTAQTDFYYLLDYVSYSVDMKNKKANIDKNKLTDILTKLKTVLDDSNSTSISDDNLLNSNSFLISYGNSYDSDNLDAKTKFSNPPVISKDDPKYFVSGTEFLCVNKKSKNLDLSCELLSYVYDKDTVLNRDSMYDLPIYKDMLKYNDILKADLKEELQITSDTDAQLIKVFDQQKLTDDYITVYNNILSNYKASIDVFNTDSGSKILDDFTNGKITVDDTANKIISLVKNMVEE